MAITLDALSTWVWIIAGLCAIIAALYGGIKWARRVQNHWHEHRLEDFRLAVTQIQEVLLVPITSQLSHLHDCVERVSNDAIAHAEAATQVAAKVEMTFDRWRVEAMEPWMAGVDTALRNIQQGQV